MCVKARLSGSDTPSVPSEPSRWLDLVSEMYASVWEGAPLHELPLGAVDVMGTGSTVVHGPWSPEECKSVLASWLGSGWIELFADVSPPWSLTEADWRPRAGRRDGFLILSTDDAVSLVNETERWVLGTDDGHVMLGASDHGQSHDYPAWLELAQRGRRD